VEALAAEARARGLTPAAVTGHLRPEAARRLTAAVDRTLGVDDPYEPGRLADAACRLAGGLPAAVVAWYDAAVVPAARAAELLGIARSPVAGLATARNKHAAREAMRAAGQPVPPFALLEDDAAAEVVARTVGLPAVIKPVSGTGSLLVRRVDTVEQLREAHRLLAGAVPRLLDGLAAVPVSVPGRRHVDPTRAFLVEGLLRGPEYCADVVVRDGEVEHVLLLDKFLVDDRFFERGFAWPALDLDPEREALVREAIEGAIAALGVDNTAAHVEVIDDEAGGPTVVEVNAGRPGGQIVVPLAVAATGVDLCAEHVSLALGQARPPRGRPALPPPLATFSLFGEGSGRLVRIHGIEALERHPDVVRVFPMASPGDLVSDEYETFPVNVLAAGLATREELLRAYAEFSALIRLECEPVSLDER
jgi:hypothetical protein